MTTATKNRRITLVSLAVVAAAAAAGAIATVAVASGASGERSTTSRPAPEQKVTAEFVNAAIDEIVNNAVPMEQASATVAQPVEQPVVEPEPAVESQPAETAPAAQQAPVEVQAEVTAPQPQVTVEAQPAPVQPVESPEVAPAAPADEPVVVAVAPADTSVAMDEVASAVFGATNRHRGADGVAALRANAGLVAIAQMRANDMAANNYLAHVSPNGDTPNSLAAAAGLPFDYVIENAAANTYPGMQAAAVADEDFWNSPVHHANVVDGRYTDIGVASATDASGQTYIVVLFGGML